MSTHYIRIYLLYLPWSKPGHGRVTNNEGREMSTFCRLVLRSRVGPAPRLPLPPKYTSCSRNTPQFKKRRLTAQWDRSASTKRPDLCTMCGFRAQRSRRPSRGKIVPQDNGCCDGDDVRSDIKTCEEKIKGNVLSVMGRTQRALSTGKTNRSLGGIYVRGGSMAGPSRRRTRYYARKGRGRGRLVARQ